MKIVILTLVSLILLVYADDKVAKTSVVPADQVPAKSLFDTIFADYYEPLKGQTSNKKSSKNKSSNRNQGSQNVGNYGYENNNNKNKQSSNNNNYDKKLKYDYNNYDNYLKNWEDYKVEYNRLIGRKGLGFDKRTATSYGLLAPITPELLQVVGQKNQKNDVYNDNYFKNYDFMNDYYRNDNYKNDNYKNDNYKNDNYKNDNYKNDNYKNDDYKNNDDKLYTIYV